MSETIKSGIQSDLETLETARTHVPFWLEPGLQDYSCTIHSTGITYWNMLGRSLGFLTIGEFPAPQQGPMAFVGGDVRSDSVWFPEDSQSPVVLVEFERFSSSSDGPKLMGKVDSLLLAHHRWNQSAKLLVLAYWTKRPLNLPDHAQMKRRIRNGFDTTARERVHGATNCQIAFFQTIVTEGNDERWKLTQIIERGV